MVIRGESISPGTLLHVRGDITAHNVNYQLSGSSSPQIVMNFNGDRINNTTPFFDTNGQAAVLMWWTSGGIGDPIHFSVNGVEGTLDDTMKTEGAASFIEVGYDEGGPDALRADCTYARILPWNRVLSTTERAGVLANLAERYL
jgi:hypothetical protein